ncbi:hypothetical protein FRC02_000190 [Tulasnella sp. 418]|nr:hypothetical protein FRC02_000190 [Tulasnella sp. 418]
MLIPCSNPERNATLEQITEQLPEQINDIDINCALQQELVRIQSRNSVAAAPSTKSAKFSISSFTSSFIDKRYIKDKVKEIGKTLPQVRDQVFRQSTITWFNQFRGLENISSNMARQDAVTETLRILRLLRSGKKIPYITAAKDLLRLAEAVQTMGMLEQASVLYDWGVQICCELGTRGSPKTLLNLAQFLHKLAYNMEIVERSDGARKIFEQAVKMRSHLEDMGQNVYLATLASDLQANIPRLRELERFSACCEIAGRLFQFAEILQALTERPMLSA